jgi:autotransporter passenger strand-loop-strand repeat protein
MPDYIEISGRTVSGFVVSAGTYLEIGSGGVAVDTLVKDGGYEITSSGGITSGVMIRAGGSELVDAGGTAFVAGVTDGGYLGVSSGGAAVGAQVSGGGTMIVFAGGSGIDTGSGAAAVISVTSVVSAGQTVSGLVIGSDTTLQVATGGRALATSVTRGGTETVLSGGAASGTVVASGGSATVDPGGAAAGTVVSAGGTFLVSQGGWATGTVVRAGGSAHVNLVVSGPEASSGLVIDAVTSLFVYAGGVTTGTTITSGGHAFVLGGSDIGATVGAGGYESISGTGDDLVVSGTLEDAVGAVTGAVIAGGGVALVDHGALGFGVASNTTITGSGLLVVEDGGVASGGITFGQDGQLVLDDGPTFAVLSNFNAGNGVDLGDLAYGSGGSASFGDGELVVTEGGSIAILQLAGNYDDATFALTSATGPYGGTLVTVSNVPCFAAGTLIATDRGAVAVERLRVGDRVVTVEGTVQPAVWIGSRTIDCRRHPAPAKVWPVRIAADAFAPGRPGRDLFLSPDHAVFAEGVLIPVKHLVNGGTVVQLAVDAVTYLHVELPHHAVILAEGLPVESYLDTGDRHGFAGMGGVTVLHPAFGGERADIALVAEALGYAPLRVTGPEVERVRAALATATQGAGAKAA